MYPRLASLVLAWLGLLFLSNGCASRPQPPEVVVYTSVDQVFSEPVLKEFEKSSGIRVLAVYDVEAAKTTGLVNRLMAEKERPAADVFWSGEIAQTLLLKEQGVLARYVSPSASTLPEDYRDKDGCWTAFGGRVRVFLVNTELLSKERYPRSIEDLRKKDYPADKIALASPLFGTTATHAAALYAALGEEEGRAYFHDLQARGLRIVDGNSTVRDLVASGQVAFGLVDTDDAAVALKRGDPVAIVFPDQEQGGLGALSIPNTVALVKGSPHPTEGQRLVDFLLSESVEQRLRDEGWLYRSTRGENKSEVSQVSTMKTGPSEIFATLKICRSDMTSLFLR